MSSNTKETMMQFANAYMMYSALNDDANSSQEIKDLVDGSNRPANIISGNELLYEAVKINPYKAETMDLQTPASSTGYELTAFDKLDQLELKSQCWIYKSALEKENDELKQLSAVFESAVSNMKWEGEAADKFKMICGDYCLVIMCLQMSKLFDADDNNKLANELGSEYLAGDVILYGIESSKAGYDSECRARDHCNYMASNADDSETRAHYHSEACIHQALANNYYSEWQRYVQLKKDFEDIRAFSITFFTSGTPYRNYAFTGMQLLANAFDGTNGYTVPKEMSDWRKGVGEHHKLQMTSYTAKWKDKNGDWDMDKLGEEICIDDDSVSEIDCVAMCYVINDIYKQEDGLDKIAKLMSSSYIAEYSPAENPTVYGAPKGFWTYRTSETYCRVASCYGDYLNNCVRTSSLTGNGCSEEFQIYNFLSAGALMSTVVPDYDSATVPAYYDCNFEISFEDDEQIDGCKKMNFNVYRYEGRDTYGTSVNTYSSSCLVFDYSNDISKKIDEVSDNLIMETLSVNTLEGEAEVIGLTALGFVPVVGPYITVAGAMYSGLALASDDANQTAACQTILQYDDYERAFNEVNLGGTMIIREDNSLIITSAFPGKDDLSQYVDRYNAAEGNSADSENLFAYNPNTFYVQYMTDQQYRNQFDDFINWVNDKGRGAISDTSI